MSNPIKQLLATSATYLASRLPVQRRTIFREVATTTVDAGALDIDMIHGILTGADNGDTRQLFALYDKIIFDAHIQGELSKRKLAVLGDQLQVMPADEKSGDDKAAADFVRKQIEGCPGFFDAEVALLDSCLWPVVVLEKIYRPVAAGRGYVLSDLVPVPFDLLDYQQDRRLRIFDTNPQTGDPLTSSQAPDPMRYIVHRGHLLGKRDHRGGPMRALVFWWLFSNFDRDWWVRFLDRFGTPFPVGKYDATDDASRGILQNAFSLASRLGGLVVSRETEVALHETASKDGGTAFSDFLNACQKEKSKLIVGQTTSAEGESTGLNSGIGKEHGKVRADIRQFDALRLGDTLVHQLFNPLLSLNGLRGQVKLVWGAEEPDDTESTSNSLARLYEAGVELTDDGIDALSGRMGLPLRRKLVVVPPVPGLTTLSAPDITKALLADAASQQISRAASADLARAFSGSLAPVRKILADSASLADFENNLRLFFADFTPERIATIAGLALSAQAANGLS